MLIKYIDNEDMLRIEKLKLRVESNCDGSTFFNDADYTSIIDFLSECLIEKQLKDKTGNSNSFTARDLAECFVPKTRTPIITIGGQCVFYKPFASKIINIICNEIKSGSKLLDMEEIYKIAARRKQEEMND